MIKIKSGVYGFRDEDGNVRPKTSKDLPFSLSPEEETRLVRRGVAVYVIDETGLDLDRPVYDAKTKNDVLVAIMNRLDIPVRDKMTKADMIAAIDAYYDAVEDDPDGAEEDDESDGDSGGDPDGDGEAGDYDDEKPPEVGAEAPVS